MVTTHASTRTGGEQDPLFKLIRTHTGLHLQPEDPRVDAVDREFFFFDVGSFGCLSWVGGLLRPLVGVGLSDAWMLGLCWVIFPFH